jgi:hypothetical protein
LIFIGLLIIWGALLGIKNALDDINFTLTCIGKKDPPEVFDEVRKMNEDD